jgi:hypothetical protein
VDERDVGVVDAGAESDAVQRQAGDARAGRRSARVHAKCRPGAAGGGAGVGAARPGRRPAGRHRPPQNGLARRVQLVLWHRGRQRPALETLQNVTKLLFGERRCKDLFFFVARQCSTNF